MILKTTGYTLYHVQTKTMTRSKFGFLILYQCQCRQNQFTGCNPKHDMFEHVGFNRESFHPVGKIVPMQCIPNTNQDLHNLQV